MMKLLSLIYSIYVIYKTNKLSKHLIWKVLFAIILILNLIAFILPSENKIPLPLVSLVFLINILLIVYIYLKYHYFSLVALVELIIPVMFFNSFNSELYWFVGSYCVILEEFNEKISYKNI